jgi:hypothetical protein
MNTGPLPRLDLDAMPEIDLRHVLVLTDDTAMLQHATHATPGLVQACLAAAYVTREAFWTKQAARCFEWFRGGNDLGAVMYNEETGGCYDGLAEDEAAANQGAESTLAYLLSVLELHAYARAQRASEDLAPGGSASG